MKIAWMIERPYGNGSSATWWCGNEDNPQKFTIDPNAAATFPTKESAEYIYRLLLDDHHLIRKVRGPFGDIIITEHGWMD